MTGIETERLVGHPVQPSDADLAERLFGDPAVAEWIWPAGRDDCEPGPRAPSEAHEILNRFVANWKEDGIGWWLLHTRDGGEFVGEVGLQPAELDGEQVVEIGWTLLSDHWGRGYATEAARAALGFGFDVVGLPEIVAFTMVQNTASLRVMEKLGMTHEREFVRAALPHALYRIRPPA